MTQIAETFGQYLQRKLLEKRRAQAKDMPRPTFALMMKEIEHRLANPLLKLSKAKFSKWVNDKGEPAPETQSLIRSVLGA